MSIIFYFFLDGNEKRNELRKKNEYNILLFLRWKWKTKWTKKKEWVYYFTFFLDGNENRNELRKKNEYNILLFLRWKWKPKWTKEKEWVYYFTFS